MPVTAAGKLTIVASADLGGLGAREGSPISYNWVLPGFAPLLLPWLAILVLLLLKSNRRASAWLILVPLGLVTAVTLAPLPILPSGTEVFLDVIGALALGLAGVWLLSNHLRRDHRLLTFVCVAPVLACFSILGFTCRQGADWLSQETAGAVIALGLASLVIALAMTVTGWFLRSRYRPVALYLGLLVGLAVFWLLCATPFFFFAELSSGGKIPWSEFFVPMLVVVAVTFVTLLPFVVLSSANRFFRERLMALLNVVREVPSPAPPLNESNLQTRC